VDGGAALAAAAAVVVVHGGRVMMAAMEPLRDRMRAALLVARKERDAEAVAALRTALAAVDNAEAVAPPTPGPLTGGVIAGAAAGVGATEAPRVELTEGQVAAVVAAEVAERRAAAAEYRAAGHADRADRLTAEADALDLHLDAGRGGAG
jgi:hypothetical protein